jgi:hypothetical protein
MAINRADVERADRAAAEAVNISHGMPATIAARMVGDHHMSRPPAISSFQRTTTRRASATAPF